MITTKKATVNIPQSVRNQLTEQGATEIYAEVVIYDNGEYEIYAVGNVGEVQFKILLCARPCTNPFN